MTKIPSAKERQNKENPERKRRDRWTNQPKNKEKKIKRWCWKSQWLNSFQMLRDAHKFFTISLWLFVLSHSLSLHVEPDDKCREPSCKCDEEKEQLFSSEIFPVEDSHAHIDKHIDLLLYIEKDKLFRSLSLFFFNRHKKIYQYPFDFILLLSLRCHLSYSLTIKISVYQSIYQALIFYKYLISKYIRIWF